MVVNDAEKARRPGTTQRRRLLVLVVCAGVWFCLLGGRLAYLQIFLHERLAARASDQQRWSVQLPGKRGDLFDRTGRLLATSIDEETIYAHPHLIDDPERAARALAPALDASVDEVLARLSRDSRYVALYRKAPPRVAEAARAVVREHGLHLSIGFTPESKRYYPNRSLAAHVLGFVNVDNVGQAGVEYAYDDLIRGEPGRWMTYRDGGNQPIDPDGLLRQEPTIGHDLTLTIDTVIQSAAESVLERAVVEHGADAGSVVAMDPRSGAILAMAAYPSFNPNRRDGALRDHWQNRAVLHAYEPGSTFKIFPAAAALEDGVVDEYEPIDCEGGRYRVANHVYRDWKPGFGVMPFQQVLVNSSNVGMIKVGMRFEPRSFYGWLRRFGFGEPTGVDLPGEAAGLLKAPDGWSALSQASMVFGQEVGVTPLQLATAASAIANGGLLVEPHVVARVQDPSGTVVHEHRPEVRRRVVSSRTSRQLLRVLEQVVAGTGDRGTPASIRDYRIAGKTGTAQKIGPEGTYSQYVSSFLGILPASDPQLVILVEIDNPDRARGYYGSQVAMPAFRAIAEKAIHALRIPPDATTPAAPLLGTS